MTKIKTAVFAVFLSILVSSCSSESDSRGKCRNINSLTGKVAKVDLYELDELLIQVALKREENADLREIFKRHKDHERTRMSSSLDALTTPGKSMKEFVEDMTSRENNKDSEVLEEIGESELALTVEKLFGEQYDMIFFESYDENVLYSKIRIHDITPQVLLYLRKQLAGANVKP